MFAELFARLGRTAAAQALLRRVEAGGALTCGGVTGSAHALLAAWLHEEFPRRPIVLVAEHLKAQETLHQDLETWLGKSGQRREDRGARIEDSRSSTGSAASPPPPLSSALYPLSSPLVPLPSRPASLLFFPAWETLPHEDKLPHADVISERLETLVALIVNCELPMSNTPERARRGQSAIGNRQSPILTTSITALLQRTFTPAMLTNSTRTLRRGDRIDPIELVEWLDDNGYDSEAQVSRKGDTALRGGIVDVFPLTSPWPVRLEFFGDELESLRMFDPVTQVSREGGGMEEVVLPPAGELGVLKQMVQSSEFRVQGSVGEAREDAAAELPQPKTQISEPKTSLATLLDYLPDETIFILCEPEAIEAHAQDYAGLVPEGDPFFASWDQLRGELLARKISVLAMMEEEGERVEDRGERIEEREGGALPSIFSPPSSPLPPPLSLPSLEAFRPITDRASAPEIAEGQRREFFLQLQRWLRQGFAVSVLCNNEGEAQRFGELWQEIGLGEGALSMERQGSEPFWPYQFSNVCHHESKVCHHGLKEGPHRLNEGDHGLKTHPHGLDLPTHEVNAPTHGLHLSTHDTNAPLHKPETRTPLTRPSGTLSPPPRRGEGWGEGCAPLTHNAPGDATTSGHALEERHQNAPPLQGGNPPLPCTQGDALGWHTAGLQPAPHPPFPIPHSQFPSPSVHLGSLSRGFLCEAAQFVVVTDAEIFGRYKVQRPRRMKSAHAIAARSALDIDFSELEEGDYVVHLQHGIGRFKGLRTLPFADKSEIGNRKSEIECLVLEYAPSDTDREPPKLYVPVTEAHLISKYVGAGKSRPPLNTLGGKRWEKTKQQARLAVRDLASDLLAIQAKRATQPGHSFGPDTPWQREFESSFLYEETADQLRAIEETKRDLELPRPTDRLICGDVGFGKTEIAIRAAFKAVMGGKQVAILVPTTVLAQQHYNTFRERMADYPVRVELLSRFRTRKEQLQIVGQLAAGAVDIVIGTHRLVQGDVIFKELGLVVIDEEQRFGVMHKEKFKQMRSNVDVLTLSATPIPRTLYLALTGARDMSTIQTPPQDRLPVETIVEHHDDRVIRDAIRRELERGGQVFFLHNRVTTIEAMRSKLRLLVPHARIVVGHGQMEGDELEEVMTKFVNGEADVLLSTTIIESGLDIPNANTIIIDRADRFGLSQLYQLRGRVGRYKHQAFAYLLLPRHARLLTDVRKRMSAIKQYAQLGSGFKIAMRDLEIRGAGNLLGAQQSGHITAVGFELYCNLLKQSVATLKGEKVRQRTDAALRLDFLKLHAVEEAGAGDRSQESEEKTSRQGRDARSQAFISVPRDSDVWVQPARASTHEHETQNSKLKTPLAGAFLPPAYIAEPQQRIEAYRKLAQSETKADVEALGRELRDRYGKWPRPVELLLAATELKLLAGERGLDAIETKGDKLMLHRRGDFIQLGGKFPRLMKTEPLAVLKEIKKLLLSL